MFLPAAGAKAYWLSYFPLFVGCGLLFTALYLLLLRMGSRKLSMWLTAAAVVLQLGTNASGLIAPSDDHTSTHEYDPAYVETADSLYEYFSSAELTALTRVKNVDGSLNAGYPAIAGVSAVSSVRSTNTDLRLGVYQELGYSVKYFRVLDTGGTVLGDMLFGVDLILSAGEPDPTLYSDTGETVDGVRIARPRYPGVIGLTYDEGALDGYLDELTYPGRLNLLYRAFTGSREDVCYTPALSLSSEGEGLVQYTLTLTPEDEALLYLAADDLMLSVTVNGEPFFVPSYQNPRFRNYPAAFNNNLLYLGTCASETVVVEFTSSPGLTEEDFTAVALSKAPLDAFRDLAGADGTTVEGGMYDESVTLTLRDVGEGRRLFLPLTYSYRWQIAVNGKSVPVEPVLGTLCGIPLEAGDNTVVITRGPVRYGFGAGQIMSLASFLLAAAWLVIRRRVTVSVPRRAGCAAQALFALAAAAMILFLYAAPVVMFIRQGSVISF